MQVNVNHRRQSATIVDGNRTINLTRRSMYVVVDGILTERSQLKDADVMVHVNSILGGEMVTNTIAYHSVDMVPKYLPRKLTGSLLFAAMVQRELVTIKDSRGWYHEGRILSIQLEDGSGKSFNVTIDNGQTFHVREA